MEGTDGADSTQVPSGADSLGGADFEDLVREVRHRMHGALDEQARLRLLIDAVVAMAADLSLDSVLARIVTIASRLVNARYAALGVLETGPGQRLRTFIHHGMDEELVTRIGHLPAGHGLLGRIIDHPEPLRLHDLTEHPQSYGFPPGHPPMHSFIGVPVLIRDQVFGNLYLTEKGGGIDFTAQDEEIVLALAAAAGVVIENARLYEEAARRETWLKASAEVTALLSGSDDAADALNIVVDRARAAAEADFAWIVSGPDMTTLRVMAVSGTDTPQRQPPEPPGSPVTRLVVGQGEAMAVEDLASEQRVLPSGVPLADLDLRSALVVPLGPRSGMPGALGLAWTRENVDRYRCVDAEMPAGFARQAALALQVLRAREDQHRLVLLEDRDRIARDLHDVVVQRLFAVGLMLQVAAPQTDSPEIERRLERAVDELDTTIKDIRRTIFALGALEPSEDIEAELGRVIERAAATLKFRPHLRCEGPVRTLVTEEVAPDLLAVLTEALSNASRHAAASKIDVTLVVRDRIVLTVTDDGQGIPHGVPENGLANLRHRAERHGGNLTVDSAPGMGTTLTWTVPLA